MDPFKPSLPEYIPVAEGELHNILCSTSTQPQQPRTATHTPLSTLKRGIDTSPPERTTTGSETAKKRRRRNRRVKGCNCKRSKCLKLYCECYAKQVFCGVDCKCVECNNIDLPQFEDARSCAIQSSLDRNSSAFFRAPIAPLAGLPRKGCKCKRSQCMKNYCECYQAGKGCIDSCRCVGCENEHGVKPPKSKRRKPDPFGAHFTHPSMLPTTAVASDSSSSLSALTSLVKTEPLSETKPTGRQSEMMPLTPEKSLQILSNQTTNKPRVSREYISSQIELVKKQRTMFERLLTQHIERLAKKERILSDMLTKFSTSLSDNMTSGTENDFQLELRRMFEQFESSNSTCTEAGSDSSPPSTPTSPLSTSSNSSSSSSSYSPSMSDHETSSDSDEDDADSVPGLVGEKWPDAEKVGSKMHKITKPPVDPTQLSVLQPHNWSAISTLDNDGALTNDGSLTLPQLPRISDPLQLLPLPIDRNTSNDSWVPAVAPICRNLSDSTNWASLVISN